MTNEQNEALNRVKANWAYAVDVSGVAGTYRTDDIEQVLSLIHEANSIIKCIEEDLIEFQAYLTTSQREADPTVDELIQSLLYFISTEDVL